MEQYFDSSKNVTLLGTNFSVNQIAEYCDYCTGTWESYMEACNCDKNSRCVGFIVEIEGNIAPSPDICTFHITLWDLESQYNDCNTSMFWEHRPTCQFTIKQNINLDRSNTIKIMQYHQYLECIQDSTWTFNSQKLSRHSYIEYFKNLVQKIYNSPERSGEKEKYRIHYPNRPPI